MTVFGCASCGAAVSTALCRVALPVHWRCWEEVGAVEAEARGVYAPVFALSFGAPGAIVIAPGDVRGLVLIPERCEGLCCGVDGRAGPNLACARCGRPVATRVDDCSLWQAVWFDPGAVLRLSEDDPADRPIAWEAAMRELQDVPLLDLPGEWSPRWDAATGAALAHLLAASAGTPVALPGGLATELFGRALAALLPRGNPTERLSFAGPGLPAPTDCTDLLLVPRHPRTGEPWRPSPTARLVPVPAEIWARIAFPETRVLVPAPGSLPDGVLRDDPLPAHPRSPFRPDGALFLTTLARLPAVRRPWLRDVYDRVRRHPYSAPF